MVLKCASNMRKATDEPGVRLVRKLVELSREGKAAGAGFYTCDGHKKQLWNELASLTEQTPGDRPP